jgi:hypothetical protein
MSLEGGSWIALVAAEPSLLALQAPDAMQERMKRLEALRLEVDSRRRTVADLQGRYLYEVQLYNPKLN